MIPTSTRVSIRLKATPPGKAVAAVLLPKEVVVADAAIESLRISLNDPRVFSIPSTEPTANVIDAGGVPRMVLIGPIETSADATQSLREAAAKLGRAAVARGISAIAVHLVDSPEAIESVVVGLMLGAFCYVEMKGSLSHETKPLDVTLLLEPSATNRAALRKAVVTADAQNLARTIASRPGNVVTPPVLAAIASDIAAEVGLSFKVLDEKQMKKLGMGGILAVGSGSPAAPPRMIVLEHKPAGKARQAPLLVVGKAITFDTGGISIKPADKMQKMIFDKCGAMAVLGLMYAVAKLKLPVHVVGIMSSAENHVSSSAYRPGDVLKMYNGVTVEVTNTDAEGRLVLADALAWGIETYKPAAVVDLATLTGGVVVALGTTMAGLMSNDDGLVAQLTAAAATAGEKIWRLPVGDDQRKMLKSDFADIVNSAGRLASPLTGAAFLTHFVPAAGTPWAHLDIAGVADTDKATPLYAVGATGFGVRTLIEWVMSHAGVKKHVDSMPVPAGG